MFSLLSFTSVTGGCSQLEYKNKSQFKIKINNCFCAIISISNLNAKPFAYLVFCVQINYFVLLLYFALVQQFQ